MDWRGFIISDQDVLMGKPVIKGTRISVEHIISLLAQGWDEGTILSNYPRLNREALQAVFLYIEACIADGLFFSPLRKAV